MQKLKESHHRLILPHTKITSASILCNFSLEHRPKTIRTVKNIEKYTRHEGKTRAAQKVDRKTKLLLFDIFRFMIIDFLLFYFTDSSCDYTLLLFACSR